MLSEFFERRASLNKANPRDPVVAEWFGGGVNTSAGESVTPDRAMRLTAVYAAVRLLASNIATLPLITYRKTSDGKAPATTSTVYTVLKDQANKWQTSAEWREMMAAHLLLRGNAYSYIERNGSGQVTGLIPLHPDRVTPYMMDGQKIYRYCLESGKEVVYLQNEVHHWIGLSLDGVVGISPISYAKETIGLSMAAETFGGAYFGNGTVLSGVLQHPSKLGDQAYERLKQSWADRHQGAVRAHKPAILEEGMQFVQLGVKPDEAQFLETRQFQVSEIARLYGVPPHMIGDVAGSTSWGSGIEQQSIGFVVYSLRPILVKIEQAIKRDLLNLQTQSGLYAKFNVSALMRGDAASRSAYYTSLWGIGSLSIDEIRELEDYNTIDGGDRHFIPLNMAELGAEPEPEPMPAPAPVIEDMTDAEEDDTIDEDLARFLPLLSAVSARVGSWQRRSLEKISGKQDFEQRAVKLLSGEHDEFLSRALGPVFQSFGASVDKTKDALKIRLTSGVYHNVTRMAEYISSIDDAGILAIIKKGLSDGKRNKKLSD